MSIPKERSMLPHVRKEHLASIRDKFDDLMVVPLSVRHHHVERLLKAVAVYLLKGGYDDRTEEGFADTE